MEKRAKVIINIATRVIIGILAITLWCIFCKGITTRIEFIVMIIFLVFMTIIAIVDASVEAYFDYDFTE